MFYTIYKVTNKINGKIYIGKHQTKKPMDLYYGSGKAIRNAIKKHGKENFIKEVLFVFETEAEMNLKEKELITEEFVLRQDTYNLGVGGEGGAHFKGKTFSEEALQKISNSSKGRIVSGETRKKLSEKATGRIVSEETRKKLSEKTAARYKNREIKVKEKYIMTEEHKLKISSSMKTSQIRNDNVKENVTCPHCNKEGQKLAMSRHHFDNCKKLLREGQDG
jgi:group I intron endonuclease